MGELDMRSAPSLQHSGGASHLSANWRLALDDPAEAWVVEEGDVLVFAIEVPGDRPAASATCLVSSARATRCWASDGILAPGWRCSRRAS